MVRLKSPAFVKGAKSPRYGGSPTLGCVLSEIFDLYQSPSAPLQPFCCGMLIRVSDFSQFLFWERGI